MVTLEELKGIRFPEKTDTYTPVLHNDFVELILEIADKKKFKVRNTKYDIAREGNIMKGIFAFEGDNPEMDMQVGVLNSYDKSKTVTIGLGSQVFICQNGMVSADYILKRRHTGRVMDDIIDMVNGSFEKLYDEYRRNIEVKDQLSEIHVTRAKYAELVGRMFLEKSIITSTQLNIVKKESYESELFPEPTAWSMYNHINHALKVGHPANYINQHIALHKFMTTAFIDF